MKIFFGSLLLFLVTFMAPAEESPAPVRMAVVGLAHVHAMTWIPRMTNRSDLQLVGIVEAKKVALGPQSVLTQAERYCKGIADSPFNYRGFRVPFLYSTNVNRSRIEVNTQGGVVKLTGKLDSVAERAAAIGLAANVRGVRSVDADSLTM